MRVGRLGQILVAHRLVLLEPTGGQDHGLLGLDRHALALALDDRADDPAVLAHQLQHPGLAPERDVAVHHRQAQPRHTGAAAGQPAVDLGLEALGDVGDVVEDHLADHRFPAGRLDIEQSRLDLGDADAAEEAHHRMDRHQMLGLVAQEGHVDRRGLMAAMAVLGAGQVGIIVGIMLQRFVAHAGAVVHEAQHFRPVLDIGVQHRRIDQALGDGVLHILAGLFQRILGAGLFGVVAARHPDAAAGIGAGAAVFLALFDDQDVLGAHLMAAHRRRHPAIA